MRYVLRTKKVTPSRPHHRIYVPSTIWSSRLAEPPSYEQLIADWRLSKPGLSLFPRADLPLRS